MAVLVCVARGHKGGQWEAFCLDYDLAVQGRSLNEARERIELAINAYVESAAKEAEPARSRLLARRAPFFVRLAWALRFFFATVFGRNGRGDPVVGFPVSCPA